MNNKDLPEEYDFLEEFDISPTDNSYLEDEFAQLDMKEDAQKRLHDLDFPIAPSNQINITRPPAPQSPAPQPPPIPQILYKIMKPKEDPLEHAPLPPSFQPLPTERDILNETKNVLERKKQLYPILIDYFTSTEKWVTPIYTGRISQLIADIVRDIFTIQTEFSRNIYTTFDPRTYDNLSDYFLRTKHLNETKYLYSLLTERQKNDIEKTIMSIQASEKNIQTHLARHSAQTTLKGGKRRYRRHRPKQSQRRWYRRYYRKTYRNHQCNRRRRRNQRSMRRSIA